MNENNEEFNPPVESLRVERQISVHPERSRRANEEDLKNEGITSCGADGRLPES
jgi:hypothetical protein